MDDFEEIIANRLIRQRKGMGWLPDFPDFRDYRPDTDTISVKQKRLGMDEKDSLKSLHLKAGYKGVIKSSKLPTKKDLRGYCPPVEDQGNLGSCTANAGVGMVEYYEKRALGRYLNASRLFLYKASRNLMHLTGDSGAYIRTTMGALVLFGVPPEEYWPYTDKPGADPDGFDREPPAFCYAFAQNYQAMQYFRLDSPFDMSRKELLDGIKTYLVANIPSMFGFTVYSSITQATRTGKIPYPTKGEEALGGHAVVVVGYDDNMEITNTNTGGLETKGAFLIRNSWGTKWGDAGYGWLPYEYVLKWLARDWWSLLKSEWVDTGMFKFS